MKTLATVLVLSVVLNVYLIYWFINKSYTIETVPKLSADVRILGKFISQNSTKESVVAILKSDLPDINFEDSKSMNRNYDTQIRLQNQIVFYFDKNEQLVAVDHWGAKLSPLWQKKP
ncbi:hypothetical protein ACJJIF_09335 [Microbulbifer sp. SSSA002]|uniref:hypothetical protein n=1 Tax=Microbulbifer sp. SSSA002 TaxID=3243376 RepID=UPI0040390C68